MNSSVIPMRVDVAVVGRGAVGMAAALAFARQGRSVVLIGPDSRRPLAPAGTDTRVFALSGQSRALLEPLGVWGAIDAARITPVTDMRVHPSGGTQARMLSFSAFEAGVEALAWIVENGALVHALHQGLAFSTARVMDVSISGFECAASAQYARLNLSDGRALEARLVIGADGAQSAVREFAGITSVWRDYPHHALTANFDTDLPDRHIAWQWFGEHGVLALLPLPPGEQAAGRFSIVWSAPLTLAEELRSLPADALAARVEAVSDQVAGRMRLISGVGVHALRLGRVSAVIGPRLALVGDAAHGVHPLAGQGMNLGFGDLDDLLAALKGVSDPGTFLALRRYERSRAEPVKAMQALTDMLQKVFDPVALARLAPFDRPLALARDLGWDLISRSGWVRRALIGHAIGPAARPSGGA
jgi:2-octaprenylphenol hydroxylase